ncbi:MAG: Ni/Fe-hydrogenase cytochrome b subunit, partial [Deltaproteobacteria bacterium]
MSSHENGAPIDKKFFTGGVKVLFTFMIVGLSFGLYRIFYGLGAITNLSNQYPL